MFRIRFWKHHEDVNGPQNLYRFSVMILTTQHCLSELRGNHCLHQPASKPRPPGVGVHCRKSVQDSHLGEMKPSYKSWSSTAECHYHIKTLLVSHFPSVSEHSPVTYKVTYDRWSCMFSKWLQETSYTLILLNMLKSLLNNSVNLSSTSEHFV